MGYYKECVVCGERYWDEDIDRYCVEVTKPGSDEVGVACFDQCAEIAAIDPTAWESS